MTRLTVFADALLHDRIATARIVFRLFHLLNDFSDFAAAHLFLHILSLSPQTLAIWNLMHSLLDKGPRRTPKLANPL